jgi:hypothetical protein
LPGVHKYTHRLDYVGIVYGDSLDSFFYIVTECTIK